jgi:glycerol uptake facilitator-like aquaporin
LKDIRPLLGEYVGSGLLTAIVIGSGVAAQQLSPHQIGLQLLENTLVTVAGLFWLINVFGPVSGAHFNPVVSFADVILGHGSWRRALTYVPAQVAGCVTGAFLANAMFGLPLYELSTHQRASGPHFLSEVIATAGLITVIFSLSRNGLHRQTAATVAAYIGAAYFFTSSTSFANPAIAVGRMFSNSFAGIAPSSVPLFILAELLGGALAVWFVKFLYPKDGPRD